MAIEITAANVRPINPWPGAVIGDVAANATITAGDLVYHNGTGWAVGALTNATTGKVQGVALAGGSSGEYIPVLTFGRVTGWTGLTAGGVIYSAADGAVSQSSATNASICGFAVNTTDIFFVGQAAYPQAS